MTADDALLAAKTAIAAPDRWSAGGGLMMAETMMRTAFGPTATDAKVVAMVRELVASVDRRRQPSAGQRSTVRPRPIKLLPAEPVTPGGPGERVGRVDTSVILSVVGWARAVLPNLATCAEDQNTVTAILRHLAGTTNSKPTRAWGTETTRLLRS